MKTKILLLTIACFISGALNSQIIHVPADYNSIQEGINAASDGDTVLVAENTYYENIRFMGKAITLASEFILDGNSSHIDNTIINGSQAADPDSAAAVMFVNGEDTTSIINGFTITGGGGLADNASSVKFGGGISVHNAGAMIVNNHITNNMVTHAFYRSGGAGIGSFLNSENKWIVIEDNIISNNQSFANSPSAFGGGIYVTNSARIRNNIIEQNSCYNTGDGADGGGVEVEQYPGLSFIVLIDNNLIQNNSVEGTNYGFGGGIASLNVPNLHITNNTIIDNISSSGNLCRGGGIYVFNNEDLVQIENNTIENNTCEATTSVRGGGICLYQCGKSIVTNNEINNNQLISESSTLGAGIAVEVASDTLFVYNNKINNNTVGGNGLGGGIGIGNWSNPTFDVVYINGNILSNNHCSINGGGLWTYNAYRTHIANNIFENNKADGYGGAISFRQYLGKAENIFSPNGLMETDSKNIAQSREDIFHPLIANNNFISNTAARGGAIDSDHGLETPIIFNSIFLDNSAPSGRDIYNNSDSAVLLYNNDIDVSKIYTPWTGADNIFCNPNFMSDSMHLDWPSLCVNAGIESLTINEETYYCPPFDIDGDQRPFDWTMPDIGADEAQWYYVNVDESISIVNSILQIYPNPFSATVEVEFSLEQESAVTIEILDITGQRVKNILQETKTPGNYQFSFNGFDLPAGIYFCVVKTNKRTLTTKLIKL